jgi:hypothetical protein
MTSFKYQEEFAEDLAASWLVGNHEFVRNTIRGLKNKAQASYIAAAVCKLLCLQADDYFSAGRFVSFMHPNN